MADSIYEKRPKGPNFLLIVILFGAAILLILGVSLLLVKKEGPKMEPHGSNPKPNARLVTPAQSGSARSLPLEMHAA